MIIWKSVQGMIRDVNAFILYIQALQMKTNVLHHGGS